MCPNSTKIDAFEQNIGICRSTIDYTYTIILSHKPWTLYIKIYVCLNETLFWILAYTINYLTQICSRNFCY